MKNNSTILIEVLLKTIDKMGIKKTIQVLQISQSLSDENKKIITLIIAKTCKHFQISEDNLKHGRGKINRTNAIIVASALLQAMGKLNQKQISDILFHFDFCFQTDFLEVLIDPAPCNATNTVSVNTTTLQFGHRITSYKHEKQLQVRNIA